MTREDRILAQLNELAEESRSPLALERDYPGIDPEIASLLPIHTRLKQLPRDIALPSTAFAPTAFAWLASAATSTTRISGLLGVSIHTSAGLRAKAAAERPLRSNARRSSARSEDVVRRPRGERMAWLTARGFTTSRAPPIGGCSFTAYKLPTTTNQQVAELTPLKWKKTRPAEASRKTG